MNRKRIIDALKKKGITFNASASNAVLNGLLRDSWLKVVVRNSEDDDGEHPEGGSFCFGGYDCEMTINGTIGTDYWSDQGYSAKQFQDELKPFAGKKVLLNIHSDGGNVWDGFAIANMISSHGGVSTKILGMAASAADVIFQSGATRIMPAMAMRMAHNASSYFYAEGNATQLTQQKAELDKTIDRLEKHNDTLAKMYSSKSGQSIDDVKAMMDNEEFMDGDESLEKGYCDELTEETPVTDCLDLSRFKRVPSAILNKFSAPVQGLAKEKTTPVNPAQQQEIVNKKAKIALLNSWGVNLLTGVTEATVTDAWLDEQIEKGKPKVAAPPAPLNQTPDAPLNSQLDTVIAGYQKILRENRREHIRNRLEAAAGEGRIYANTIPSWTMLAESQTDDPSTGNPILNQVFSFAQMPPPGREPLSIVEVENTDDPNELRKGVVKAMAPRNAMLRNGSLVQDEAFRKDLSVGAKSVSKIINKTLKNITKHLPENDLNPSFDKSRAIIIEGYLNSIPAIMNDAQAGPYGGGTQGTTEGTGAVTISTDLQRQVILSEAMRAFKRRLYPLMAFAHNFHNVALQGTDTVMVPYYPLFTGASQRFIATQGYQFINTDVENRRLISVGGVGGNNKIPGQDRAYQALTFSAYLLRRQPWLDVQRLTVMRAEQLALDILNDIFTAWISKANFGNAAWSGGTAAFDETVVAFLQGVANKSDWPEQMRNLVIGTDYYTNLASSPYVKAYLNIGDTDTIRHGKIGGLYGFEETIGNPRIPETTDGNLFGFIAYPSSVLVATAPILPAPGEMKMMVSYDQVQDEDTSLTLEYKYWGEPWNSADREVIESNYGSGLGELNALKRLVIAGT